MADKVDPGLRAATRGLRTGSREYQKAVKDYMESQAEAQGQAAKIKAQIEREERDAAAKRERDERERLAKEEADKASAKASKDRQTSLITAGVASGAGGLGMAGGILEDKGATKKADKILEGRSRAVTGLADAARNIDPNAPGARGLYNDIGSAARRTGALNPRVVPYKTGLLSAGLGAAGAYSSFNRAPKSLSDEERAVWTGLGYGEMGAAAKMAASGVHRFKNPGVVLPSADVATVEGAIRMGEGKQGLGSLNVPQQPPAQPAGPSNPAQPSASPARRNSERLIEAAKAAGASGKLTKDSAAKFLARNVRDNNRTAVAAALGVKPGKNYGPRIKAAIKDLTPRGKSGFLLPGAMGLAAYESYMNPAEAGVGGQQGKPSQLGGLAAGATAAGATAAIPYAMSKLPVAIGGPLGVAGFASGMYDEAAGAIRGEDTDRDVMASPQWQETMAMMDQQAQQHDMAQVPSRNPARPTSGMFEQGNDPEFEAALQAFLQEYEADNGGPEGTMAEAY